MKKLTGSIVALVTPFHEDGSVDFARLRELCDWHIANGTDAILALGTTGETASTSLEEDIKTLECVIDHVNGRVPVIAGAGSNSSEMQKHKSVIYSQMGASALLCISPYYVKTMVEAEGTLTSIEEWGKRRLAYPINDLPEGYYVLMNCECKPELPAELDRVFKITDGILRSIIVAVEA